MHQTVSSRRSILFLFVWTVAACDLSAADRPNIVWLLSEDNSKHYLQLFDPNGAPTPRLAKLAERGLVFEHAFSNSPVCSVARTTLITGCYGPRIGTQFHRRSITVPLPGELRMFPAYLREAGYYTTNRQKKDYNAVEGSGVWDASSRRASWRQRKPDQPFFHMQSFGASHESSLHFPARDLTGKPTRTPPSEVRIAPYHPDTPTFRYTYARYHDRIAEIDRQIGDVVDALRTDGLLEDTFIFYFGDHGGVLPRSKGYVYESGLHVPLVVRVPEKWRHLAFAKPGTRVQGFVSFVDFGPTVLRLAGLDVPAEMDGRPFLGAGVSRADVESRNEALGYADRFDEKYDFVRSLRKGSFKYIRNYQPFNIDGLQNNYRYRMLAYAEWRRLHREGQLNDAQRQFFEPRTPEALYDLATDPHETRNLAHRPEHAERTKALRARLSERLRDLPDLSFFPESELVARGFSNPTSFGQAEREAIGRYMDIADTSLLSFDEARPRLEAALASKDRWDRYWGCIALSSHGERARPLAELARTLAAEDPERLVRVRAAEFLGLRRLADPRPAMLAALGKSESAVEACLILNSLALMRDASLGFDVTVSASDVPAELRKADQVPRRLEYLAP